MPPKTILSGGDIKEALQALDVRVGESELLVSVAPIRLMCAGGCLAVTFFQIRSTTKDVDCLIDPNVDAAEDYHEALFDAVEHVAHALGLERDWMNDELKGFIARPRRMDLFLRSVQQNIIYNGQNYAIYAASMEWALESKIRRVGWGRARRKDAMDAAAIVKYMKGDGPPLSIDYLRGLNFNGFETPMDNGIEMVRKEYEAVYREVGIAEMIWDPERKCYRYLDIHK